MEQAKKTFLEMLPKIYGMYTGGFIAFIILMAILEQMGLGADTIGILFIVFTVVVYAGIGWLSRTMQVEAYYVAGRQVPALFNGMATAETGCPELLLSQWPGGFILAVMDISPFWWVGPEAMFWSLL